MRTIRERGWGPVIVEYYAASEGIGATIIDSAGWLSHKGSVGPAMSGTIHILDDDGNELPTGEIGTIYFSGEQATFKYHNEPEKTAGAFNEKGWATTGDVGYVNEDGFLYLTDRKNFRIISGGVNIYPQEIENLLITHDKVADVAVFGIPHEEFGETVQAVVEPMNWADATDEVAMIAVRTGEVEYEAGEAIESAYARGEGDEFILPTVIGGYSGMTADEPVLFFNFRSDRARQLSAAFAKQDFDNFERGGLCLEKLVCMTEYDASFPFPVLFAPQSPEQVLAEVISDAGLRQLHCSETEKFAHVTYFFNGGREPPFELEDRIIVPSPAVATYDLQPEMSAAQIANKLIEAIQSGEYAFIVTNFANADMVGHTARSDAIIRAVETLDIESHRVFRVALQNNWRILLTSDHGNCDEMINPNTGEPHTQHTEYPVPFLLMGEGPVRLSTGRGLADVAPTILELLGVPQPPVMTGRSLIRKRGLR